MYTAILCICSIVPPAHLVDELICKYIYMKFALTKQNVLAVGFHKYLDVLNGNSKFCDDWRRGS